MSELDDQLDSISVEEFVDRIVELTIETAILGALCRNTKYFYIGGWDLHKAEIRYRKFVRKYIEHYVSRPLKICKITIPGIKLTKRPKKPK